MVANVSCHTQRLMCLSRFKDGEKMSMEKSSLRYTFLTQP